MIWERLVCKVFVVCCTICVVGVTKCGGHAEEGGFILSDFSFLWHLHVHSVFPQESMDRLLASKI